METVKLTCAPHRGVDVVFVRFPYDQQLVLSVKQLDGATWSQTMKSWYIPEQLFDLDALLNEFRGKAHVDYSEIGRISGTINSLIKKGDRTTIGKSIGIKSAVNPGKGWGEVGSLRRDINKKINSPANQTSILNSIGDKKMVLPKGFLEKLEQKRYSNSTINMYTNYFMDFQRHFAERDLGLITKDEINGYLLSLIKENNISNSQQNQRINSIKFYYEKVLGREKEYYTIERPLGEKRLPDVLSKQEIEAMLRSTSNIKHRCLIALIYSCGLRRSEAINMKIEDIDTERMMVKIKAAKGKKDRYVQLSGSMLTELNNYFSVERPNIWVFEGAAGCQYSATSIEKDIKNAAKRAGIKRRVHPHILRHSYATHHLEQGTDLRYIQEFLGHGSSKTTEIYTHVSKTDYHKFKNPLDDLKFNNDP